MKILTISTTNNLFLGLYEASAAGVKLGKSEFSKAVHEIAETIDSLYDKVVENSKLALVVVDLGPGSYTGSRIGVSFVKGLAFGTNVPIIGVSLLDAICYQKFVTSRCKEGTYEAQLDARNDNAFSTKLTLPSDFNSAKRSKVTFRKATNPDEITNATFEAMTSLGLLDFTKHGSADPVNMVPIYGRPVNITPSKK